MPIDGVTILSYHSIDDLGTPLSVSPRLFAQQMEMIAAEGCTTLTMREVSKHFTRRSKFPKRALAITFDDGFENVLTNALPILAKHKLKATVFIITGMAGKRTAWTDRGKVLPSLPILDWPQVAQLHRAEVEIGAHSITHGFLTQYTDADLHDELSLPKEELESRLNTTIQSFAYPQGDYDPRVVSAVQQAGYSTAVTVDQGRATPNSHPLKLPRLLVSNNTSPEVMRAFISPAMTPAYKLINFVMHNLKRNANWPRRAPGEVDSTGTVVERNA